MRRRDLLRLIGGAAGLLSIRAGAQEQKPIPVIGYLAGEAPGPNASYVAAFREGLSERGWVEGQNVLVEYRWAEGD